MGRRKKGVKCGIKAVGIGTGVNSWPASLQGQPCSYCGGLQKQSVTLSVVSFSNPLSLFPILKKIVAVVAPTTTFLYIRII